MDADVRGYILDMDGTLYRGDVPLAGGKRLLEHLNGLPHLLMTNCPFNSPLSLSKKLLTMGMTVSPEKIVTSGQLAIHELKKKGINRIYLIGSPDLKRLTEEAGFILSDDHPQAVLIGYTSPVPRFQLDAAAAHICKGAEFYCTNMDMVIPAGPSFIPHTGNLVKLLEERTGKRAINIGKPSSNFLSYACNQFQCKAKEICLIGDNLETDIFMGQQFGCKTYLLLTGVTTWEGLCQNSVIHPTRVFQDLMELIAYEFPEKK